MDTEQDKLLSGTLITAVLRGLAQADYHSHIKVEGESMSPLLHRGDTVVVAHRFSGLRPGDILVYRMGTQSIVHRLLRQPQDGVLHFGGDRLIQPDAPVQVQQVFGQVLAVITQTGQFSVTSRLARIFGKCLAACFPYRKYPVLRRLETLMAYLFAWIIRR